MSEKRKKREERIESEGLSMKEEFLRQDQMLERLKSNGRVNIYHSTPQMQLECSVGLGGHRTTALLDVLDGGVSSQIGT